MHGRTMSSRNPIRSLRLTYIVALSLIALMTISAQVGLRQSIDRLGSDSSLINVAGRQRMLSQQLAKEALRVHSAIVSKDKSGAEHAFDTLSDSHDLWVSSHERLLNLPGTTNLGHENSDEVLKLYDQLNPVYVQMHNSIVMIRTVYQGFAGELNEHLLLQRSTKELGVLSDEFLPIMNQIVNQYEVESQSKIVMLLRAEMAIGILTLSVLLFEALLVFEPATRMLRRAIDESNHANRAKSEFLANMSHEIRTPMTAILGYTQILKEDLVSGKSTSESQESIDIIQRNGKHLITVINDILDMSKIEAGKLSIEKIETNPVQIVEEAVSLMRARSLEKRVDLRVEYTTDMPEQVMSDPVRVRQILINLIGNAVKFTHEGDVRVRVSADKQSEKLRFEVIDSGVGMTPDHVEKIRSFDSFNQADASTTRKFGGTGLGLKISKTLADMLNGDILIESEHGTGSSFTLEFSPEGMSRAAYIDPHNASMQEYAEVAKAAEDNVSQNNETYNELNGIRILLAEDGVDNQRLISHYIKKAGGEITVADNGRIALDLMGDNPSEKFDVVLMDMQMPELDGYGAARIARSAGFGIPIIALTAHAMPEDRAKCLEAGCSDFMTKPVVPRTLIDTIQSWNGHLHGSESRAA